MICAPPLNLLVSDSVLVILFGCSLLYLHSSAPVLPGMNAWRRLMVYETVSCLRGDSPRNFDTHTHAKKCMIKFGSSKPQHACIPRSVLRARCHTSIIHSFANTWLFGLTQRGNNDKFVNASRRQRSLGHRDAIRLVRMLRMRHDRPMPRGSISKTFKLFAMQRRAFTANFFIASISCLVSAQRCDAVR